MIEQGTKFNTQCLLLNANGTCNMYLQSKAAADKLNAN